MALSVCISSYSDDDFKNMGVEGNYGGIAEGRILVKNLVGKKRTDHEV